MRLRSTTSSRTSASCAGAWSSPASLAVSWLVGYLLAWRFTRRIRRLEAAAERLADGDFETPVVDGGRDEVGQLDAFDGMRMRLAVLDRARREFIANASHELRTPLFSLGGFVELLDDEEITPDVRRDFLGEMRDQIDRLTRLATDLLDLSRLDAGQLEVEIGPFDLATTGRLVADEFRAVAEAAGHELVVEADATVRRSATSCACSRSCGRSSRTRFATPPGTTVVVRVVRRGGTAVLEVRDDGPGIPARIRSTCSSASTVRRRQGLGQRTGAGDRVRARLARLGGSIELSSRPGSTVFTLNLPPAEPGGRRKTSWRM